MTARHSTGIQPRVDRKGQSYGAFAPYNFVPLPHMFVAAPEPLDHDTFVPEPTAYTGEVRVTLETCSPTYVRSMLTQEQYDKYAGRKDELSPEEKAELAGFFSVREGDTWVPRIPGSSLRGMLRGLVEIIGHGRMHWVAPQPTFTFRAVAATNDDPLRQPYQNVLGKFGSEVKAGYLFRDNEGWWIEPAKTPESVNKQQWQDTADKAFLKVSEGDIGNKDIPGYRRFDTDDYAPAYFEVSFDAEVRRGPVSYTHLTLPTILRV